jgi:hypothetical protein
VKRSAFHCCQDCDEEHDRGRAHNEPRGKANSGEDWLGSGEDWRGSGGAWLAESEGSTKKTSHQLEKTIRQRHIERHVDHCWRSRCRSRRETLERVFVERDCAAACVPVQRDVVTKMRVKSPSTLVRTQTPLTAVDSERASRHRQPSAGGRGIMAERHTDKSDKTITIPPKSRRRTTVGPRI